MEKIIFKILIISISLFFIASICSCSEVKTVSTCPFSEIKSERIVQEDQKDVQNSFNVNTTINANIKKIGEIEFSIGDSLKHVNRHSQKLISDITYEINDIKNHNKIVSALCMKYDFFKDPDVSEESKHKIESGLINDINEYFEFLLGLEKEQIQNPPLDSFLPSTKPKTPKSILSIPISIDDVDNNKEPAMDQEMGFDFEVCNKNKVEVIAEFESLKTYEKAKAYAISINKCWLNASGNSKILIGTKNEPSIQEIGEGRDLDLKGDELYEFLSEKVELREQLNAASAVKPLLGKNQKYESSISEQGGIVIRDRKLMVSYTILSQREISKLSYKRSKAGVIIPISIALYEGEIKH